MSGRPDSNRRRSAWKADALPTELHPRTGCSVSRISFSLDRLGTDDSIEWRVMDSNHRRHSRQIYSLLPLATRATLRIYRVFSGSVQHSLLREVSLVGANSRWLGD